MRFIVIRANAVRRAGRSEARCVGEVEADGREEAERLAAENRPGKQLTVRLPGPMATPNQRRESGREPAGSNE